MKSIWLLELIDGKRIIGGESEGDITLFFCKYRGVPFDKDKHYT